MRRTRLLGVALAVLALAVAASSASAAEQGKGKKNKGHHAHGVVTKIDHKDGDSFTVKIVERKKKGAAAAAEPAAAPVEKTFKVTADTKFFKAPAEKGGEKQPATFADLKDGEHLVVAFEGDVATEVTIHAHHHKKKPTA